MDALMGSMNMFQVGGRARVVGGRSTGGGAGIWREGVEPSDHCSSAGASLLHCCFVLHAPGALHAMTLHAIMGRVPHMRYCLAPVCSTCP